MHNNAYINIMILIFNILFQKMNCNPDFDVEIFIGSLFESFSAEADRVMIKQQEKAQYQMKTNTVWTIQRNLHAAAAIVSMKSQRPSCLKIICCDEEYLKPSCVNMLLISIAEGQKINVTLRCTTSFNDRVKSKCDEILSLIMGSNR